jgi:hypothetical protein
MHVHVPFKLSEFFLFFFFFFVIEAGLDGQRISFKTDILQRSGRTLLYSNHTKFIYKTQSVLMKGIHNDFLFFSDESEANRRELGLANEVSSPTSNAAELSEIAAGVQGAASLAGVSDDVGSSNAAADTIACQESGAPDPATNTRQEPAVEGSQQPPAGNPQRLQVATSSAAAAGDTARATLPSPAIAGQQTPRGQSPLPLSSAQPAQTENKSRKLTFLEALIQSGLEVVQSLSEALTAELNNNGDFYKRSEGFSVDFLPTAIDSKTFNFSILSMLCTAVCNACQVEIQQIILDVAEENPKTTPIAPSRPGVQARQTITLHVLKIGSEYTFPAETARNSSLSTS